MRCRALLLSSLLLGACATDVLTPEMVTSIPEGSAIGSEHSGRYDLEVRTVECDGACGPFEALEAPLCEVGRVERRALSVRQVDGQIRIDSPDDRLAVLEGGADQDGSFEVGAYTDEAPGALERAAHARGSINELGELSGALLLRTFGPVGEATADCTSVLEMVGARDDDARE